MKIKKWVTILSASILILVAGYVVKMSIIGYKCSGKTHSFNEIEQIKAVNHGLFDEIKLNSPIEYYINVGYNGRGYLNILLKFEASKTDFINMIFYNLEKEQVEESLWFGRGEVVEKIGSMPDKGECISRLKRRMGNFGIGKFDIDEQCLHGSRVYETSHRTVSLEAVFDIGTNTAMVIISSSYKGLN